MPPGNEIVAKGITKLTYIIEGVKLFIKDAFKENYIDIFMNNTLLNHYIDF